MTILHISDTHNLHRYLTNLPEAYALMHSGDVSMTGSAAEVTDLIEWFVALPYAHKIFIGGNHDYCLMGKSVEGV